MVYAHYDKLVTRSAVAATLLSVSLLLIKILAWWYTGSVSLLAAMVDSLVDFAASFSNLLIIRFALQPADKEHTFGHGKAESLAALVESMFVSGSALFLLLTSIQHILRPEAIHNPEIGIYVTLLAFCSTSLLVCYQRYVVRITVSQAIQADMLHYQTDLLMNKSIAMALIFSVYGVFWVDAWAALAISLFIFYSAIKISYTANQSLLDRALPSSETDEILQIIRSYSHQGNILGVHDLRTRRSGITRSIQLHLEIDDQVPLSVAHQYADQIEEALHKRFPGADIIIHQDPSSSVAEDKRGKFMI